MSNEQEIKSDHETEDSAELKQIKKLVQILHEGATAGSPREGLRGEWSTKLKEAADTIVLLYDQREVAVRIIRSNREQRERAILLLNPLALLADAFENSYLYEPRLNEHNDKTREEILDLSVVETKSGAPIVSVGDCMAAREVVRNAK